MLLQFKRESLVGPAVKVLESLSITCDSLYAFNSDSFRSKPQSASSHLCLLPLPSNGPSLRPVASRCCGIQIFERGRNMKLQSSVLRNSLFVLTLLLAFPAFRAAAQSKPDAAPPAQASADAQARQSKSQPGLKPLSRDGEKLESLQEGADFLQRRQDWFFKPRAFPIGFIPQGARERALEQKRQMYQREGRFNLLAAPGDLGFVTPPTGPTSNWFSIGPQATSTPFFAPFTSGRVTALAVNPLNASNVYLGGADGGLWVTTDGGATWFALAQTENPPSAGVPSIAVGSLAVDPTTCSATVCTTVYVGTGEDNFGGENIYGEGVLKCIVAAGPPPTATCTQDNSFHLSTGAPLDNLRGGPMIGALAVNPHTPSVLLAGVRGRSTAIQSGIYCSADSGVTWQPVFGISGIVGTDVAFASDGTAFVALGFPFGDAANNGIYKSKLALTSCTTDASGTAPSSSPNWTKQSLPAGTPAASLGRITLAIFPSAASTGANATVYAAIADSTTTSSNLLGVIKTANGGTTPWTQLTGDLRISSGNGGECNGQCFYDMPLAVSPASPGDVFFGGAASNGTLIRSLDGGATWTEISRNNVSGATDTIHVDMHAIAFSGNGSTMYVGNDGGIWKAANSTGTPGAGFWTNLNQNLSITQFYPGVSIHPSNTGFSMGGTQDNDVQVYQGFTGPALLWQTAQIGCDGGFTAIDFKTPSTSFGECEYVPNIGFPFPVILTTFNGDGILGNGFLANSGIDPADRGSFIPPLIIDPNTPTTLYFGTCSVWASTDGANSWSTISPDVTTPAHPPACPVPTVQGQPAGTLSTIAVAPGNSSIIYVGSDDGDIEVTSNGGTSWATIATATLPARSVTQVAVDPSTATTAYATFSGFGTCATFCSPPTGHVFKTVNGAAGAATTWVDISGTTTKLPDIPVNAIVIDPNDVAHNTLYVGTDIGGFFTTDGGLNWSPLGAASSLPNAQILSLTLHNPSRTLRAATHGRGVWDLDLGGQAVFGLTSISPFSTNAPGTAFTLTVNGNGFVSGSTPTVNWNGTPKTTTFASATQLTASILASDVASGAANQVTVRQGASTSNSLVYTALNPIPGITSISPTTAVAGSSGLTLTVNGSNFLTGATLVLFNTFPLPANAVTVTSPTTLTVQVPAANLATAQTVSVDTFNPQPGGGPDLNPTPPTLTITAGAGSFTVGGAATTVTAGSSTNSTITVTSTSFAGTVAITCATTFPGVTCAALGVPVTSGATATGQLAISVTGPSSATTAMNLSEPRSFRAANLHPAPAGRNAWWTLSGGTGFAAIFLLLLPGRKRYRAALGLGLVCVLSFTVGCGGGSSGGSGMTATVTHLTVSTTKVAATGTLTISATVTGGTPAGNVQFFADGAAAGNPFPVSGGTTGNIMVTAANVPPLFQLIGTHSLSAHYPGDSTTLASTSGTLNVTVTGTANLPITGTSGSTTASGNVSLTIQ